MQRKRAAKVAAEQLTLAPRSVPLPVRAPAAFSFLKEMRGMATWTVADISKSLKLGASDAKQVLAMLELQGYVKQTGAHEWITTFSGEAVSGSKPPRYTLERVEAALAALQQQIAEINKDSKSPYRISQAMAFGDFLHQRARVQAAEVGIQLDRRVKGNEDSRSASERKAEREFLKQLQQKGGGVHVRAFEEWMSKRTHRALL
jgi:hypothetical protein